MHAQKPREDDKAEDRTDHTCSLLASASGRYSVSHIESLKAKMLADLVDLWKAHAESVLSELRLGIP